MSHNHERKFTIAVDADREPVSAIATLPEAPFAGLVFAHGAGAGMNHNFMVELAEALAGEQVAVLRFNFPYMESGRRAPDRQPLLVRTVRASVAAAPEELAQLPLFAGGKSMGGRMTSLAHSAEPLAGVTGLVFLGFPLHAAGRPGTARADHLKSLTIPLLFVQGTRDRLAEIDLMRQVIGTLPENRASLVEIESGDHSFRLPARSRSVQDDVFSDVAQRVARWMALVLSTGDS